MKEFIHLALTLFFFEKFFSESFRRSIEKKEKTNNRTVTVQQNDEKISCIPDLVRLFFVTLPSSFFSPSCCVSSHCARSSGDDVRPPWFEPLLHKYSRGLDGVLTHIREDLLQMQPLKSFIVYIFQAKIKPDRVYRLNEFIDPHAI